MPNMTNNEIANMLIMVLGIMITILVILVSIFFVIRAKTKKNEKSKQKEEETSNKPKVQQLYSLHSIFNFMEFDKIEDNMIVQKNGKKFIMIVKCQGVNYDLMSSLEKNSVEQGFVQYLNSLRYPIQLFIQTKTVDLTGSINSYKEKVKKIEDDLNNKEFEYNQKLRSGKFEREDLMSEQYEVAKLRNLYEYGTDIVKNTERMSLNRNILMKQYYVVLAYYPEEASNSVYSPEEVSNIAFGELYTRAQTTISLLSVCGITSKILDSEELADLLYTTYNRDEAETYDLQKALNSGYDSIYTTSQDVLEKKMKELDKQIEFDAIQKANKAIQEVRHERELEREVREKEEKYADIVRKMANLVLESNEDMLGEDLVDDAIDKINSEVNKAEKKEEVVDEKVKRQYKRAGRPKRTA